LCNYGSALNLTLGTFDFTLSTFSQIAKIGIIIIFKYIIIILHYEIVIYISPLWICRSPALPKTNQYNHTEVPIIFISIRYLLITFQLEFLNHVNQVKNDIKIYQVFYIRNLSNDYRFLIALRLKHRITRKVRYTIYHNMYIKYDFV